jgi:phosphomannomutase
MNNIKFGQEGWISATGDGFTVGNVARIARASARWLVSLPKENPSAVIGYDTRFGGKMFAETAAKVFALTGAKVYLSDRFVSTPMVSYGVAHMDSSIGVVISAGNCTYEYNGIKLKGYYGGPMTESEIRNIENLIPELNEINLESLDFNEYIESGIIEYINLEEIYIQHLKENFDLDTFSGSEFNFAFDAMYGSGQKVLKSLFPGIHLLHCRHDLSFGGFPPDPVERNLQELSEFVRQERNISCGIAIDGDAERMAMVDSSGNYIDPDNILLLLIHYLHQYKGFSGKVVAGYSSSSGIEKLCSHYGLEVQRVKTGMKEICNIMIREKVLVGGDQSGIIALHSHIPDGDGIWAGLLVMQFMIETGRSLRELLDEVYSITGEFAFVRSELIIDRNRKNEIVEKCKNNHFRRFGSKAVEKVEQPDGYKFIFNNDEWLMIKVSSADPVIYTYAESYSRESALEILKLAREEIMGP